MPGRSHRVSPGRIELGGEHVSVPRAVLRSQGILTEPFPEGVPFGAAYQSFAPARLANNRHAKPQSQPSQSLLPSEFVDAITIQIRESTYADRAFAYSPRDGIQVRRGTPSLRRDSYRGSYLEAQSAW